MTSSAPQRTPSALLDLGGRGRHGLVRRAGGEEDEVEVGGVGPGSGQRLLGRLGGQPAPSCRRCDARGSRCARRSTRRSVSSVASRSALVTTLSGSAVPQPASRIIDGARSRGAEPRHRLAAGEPLAADREHAHDRAAEGGADGLARHVAHDAAPLDLLARLTSAGSKMPAAGLTTSRSAAKRCSPSCRSTAGGLGGGLDDGVERLGVGGPRGASRRGLARLASPVRTVPGPSSTKVVAPAARMQSTLSLHRTGAVSCASSRAAMPSPSRWGWASTLATTGTSPSREAGGPEGPGQALGGRHHERGVERAARPAAASTLRAPSSFASLPAAAMASGSPAITTCPAPLRLATHTSPPACSQASATTSSSAPRTAAIVPGRASAAACMAAPRSVTRRTPSARARLPTAVRAEYSPRLWPAAMPQRTPEGPHRVVDDEAQDVGGELRVLGAAQLFGVGVEQEGGHVAAARLRGDARRGTKTGWSTQGRPMPGCWEP